MSIPALAIPSERLGEPCESMLAPFALLRIASLPYKTLEDLRLPETERLVEQVLHAQQGMQEHRAAIADALFAAVPRLPMEDTKLRRAVLALRRDVHNGRPVRLPAAQLECIANVLDPAVRMQFQQWIVAQGELDAASRKLAPTLAEEIQAKLRPALRKPLMMPVFRRALTFASPGVERSAAREKKLPTTARPDNLERSLLGYLARAAAKTSPFSSFMSMSVIGVDPKANAAFPGADRPCYSSCAYLNRGIVARLYRAALPEAARSHDVMLRVNSTLRPAAQGRLHALCEREIVLIGRPWYEQRFAQFKLDVALASCLQETHEDRWHGWCQRLRARGIAEEQIKPTLLRLLERGLLTVQALHDGWDAEPLTRLIQFCAVSASPKLREWVPTLAALGSCIDAIGELAGEPRIAALQSARDAEQTLLGAVGISQAERYDNVVLEDCWLNEVRGVAGGKLLEPLQDLERFLSDQVIVSPYYERLRAHFVRLYGAGGQCPNALDFLLRVADKLVDIPEFGARMRAPVTTPAPDGATIPVTAHVQIAAAAGAQRAALVVNRVFDGAGWLAARYTIGDQPEQQLLREKLTQWLRVVSRPREPVDVVLGGHCSDLQAHAPLTARVLGWPGEPLRIASERIIPAQSLRLVHNRTTDLIDVFDAHGVPLNLVYLGATFPSPIWGLRYALSILTQPYLLARPSFDPPQDRANDAISFEPAIVQGSLVLRRATWWAPTSYLKREWFAGSEAERLVQVRRECAKFGVPQVCFAQRYIAPERTSLIPGDVLNANRKPLWVDLRNPFWLAMLERIAEDGDWVFFTEPLPGREGLWLKVGGEAHVSELHLELIVRARSAGRGRSPELYGARPLTLHPESSSNIESVPFASIEL